MLLVVLPGGPERPAPPPTATQPPAGPPVPPPVPAAPLSAGITEANPHLVAPGPQPPEFAPWRDRLQALQPRYLRILVDWRRVQPSPSSPPDWSQPADGCLRGRPPCAAFSGIADELRAAAAARMVPVIVILGTPDWAASPAQGCESSSAGAAARMPADLEAYRVLIRSLLALGLRERIALPWWSPWNEPNHPLFFGPQRAACDAEAAAESPARYAELVRAAQAELAAAPGDQRIVLGEVAGFDAPRANAVGAAEFARALPDDVVCAAGVWAQHAYVKVSGELAADAAAEPGAPRILRDVTGALDAHGCPGAPLPVWITETGAASQDGRAGCMALARALALWSDDPRVDVAMQYTFREDTAFRVGLADPRLTRLEPAYAAWQALATGALGDPAAACAP